MFRLKSIEEIKNLNLFQDRFEAITFVEWPDIIEKKPKNLIELFFKYKQDHQKRSLKIKGLNL